LGPLTAKQQELVTTLELVRIEEFIPSSRGFPGRPRKDRTAIARAFVAKMVYNKATARALGVNSNAKMYYIANSLKVYCIICY
jgi:hypothetical protein